MIDESSSIAALERRLEQLEDKEAIRQAVYSYAHGADRCDRPLIAAAYHEDAWDDHGSFDGGRDEVADRISANLVGAVNAQHHIGNILIELDGAFANVESYFISVLLREVEGTMHTRVRAGRYLDRFEKRGGVWRITRRQVVDDWSRTDPVGELPAEVGPQSNCRWGARDRTDPVYELSDFGSPGEPDSTSRIQS